MHLQLTFHISSWPRSESPLVSLLHYLSPKCLRMCVTGEILFFFYHFFPVLLSPTGGHGEPSVKTEMSPSIFRSADSNHWAPPLQLILFLSLSRSSYGKGNTFLFPPSNKQAFNRNRSKKDSVSLQASAVFFIVLNKASIFQLGNAADGCVSGLCCGHQTHLDTSVIHL